MVSNYKLLNNKKYMWDGKIYGRAEEAKNVAESYKKNNFETEVLEEAGQYLVYTRRVVTEVKVEGTP